MAQTAELTVRLTGRHLSWRQRAVVVVSVAVAVAVSVVVFAVKQYTHSYTYIHTKRMQSSIELYVCVFACNMPQISAT